MEHGDRLVVQQQMLDEGQRVNLHVGRGLLLAEGVLRAEMASRIWDGVCLIINQTFPSGLNNAEN